LETTTSFGIVVGELIEGLFPSGYDKLSILCVGDKIHSDCILITLATPKTPLSFTILASGKPHTRSDTSLWKTPSVSDPEKLIFRRLSKEKTPTTYATITSFFEASSSLLRIYS